MARMPSRQGKKYGTGPETKTGTGDRDYQQLAKNSRTLKGARTGTWFDDKSPRWVKLERCGRGEGYNLDFRVFLVVDRSQTSIPPIQI